jgi:hypothetical protein
MEPKDQQHEYTTISALHRESYIPEHAHAHAEGSHPIPNLVKSTSTTTTYSSLYSFKLWN